MKYDIKPEELERIRPASDFSYRMNLNKQVRGDSTFAVRKAISGFEDNPNLTKSVYEIGNNTLHNRMVARRAVRIARRKGYHARWQVDGYHIQLVISLKPLGIPAPSDELCVWLFCGALVVGIITFMLWQVGIL